MPKKNRISKSSTAQRVAIPGSERRPVTGAKVAGKVDPEQRIEITLQLRRRAGTEVENELNRATANSLAERRYLTREELARVGSADPNDVASVEAFAHDHNLTVSDVSLSRRTVRLSGTIADLSRAFGVTLKTYKAGGITYRGRTGAVYVSKSLEGVVERVLGLDDRPVVSPHFRVLARGSRRTKNSGSRAASRKAAKTAAHSFKPSEVASLYNFPTGVDGTGQTVALIELNDIDRQGNAVAVGYDKADLDAFFAAMGVPTPEVSPVGVDGGANLPGVDLNGDIEVTLDIEVAAAVAPGAKYVVYFGTNTTDGFIQALTSAIHDTVRKPSIISISWGGPEESSTPQLLSGLEQALQEAALIGVTVCVAAGDDGSADMKANNWDRKPHADFPASSPHALACGGTTLLAQGTKISESVWNRGARGGATGGGVSNFFSKPSYQTHVNVPPPATSKGGRGVPDVAGDADPATGYQILVAGKSEAIGGTSAVAPLWAGLFALINQALTSKGKNAVGFANPLLYGAASSAGAFHDISSGNNDIYGNLKGKYAATKGWDPCTGLGTPDGRKILAAL